MTDDSTRPTETDRIAPPPKPDDAGENGGTDDADQAGSLTVAVDRSDRPARHGWPLSNYALTLSIVLFGFVGIALFFADNALANTLTLYAYYALTVGVLLRFVEFVVGDSLRVVLVRLREGVGTLSEKVAARGDASADRLRTDGSADTPLPTEKTPQWLSVSRVREGVGLAVPLTLGGGLLLAAWWWFDPTTSLSLQYLGGLVFAATLLIGVYMALSTDER